MRDFGFILFLVLVLSVYGFSHVYLFKRLLRALPPAGPLRFGLFLFALAWALLFIGGRFLFGRHPGPAAGAVIGFGYLYLALWNVTLWLTLAYDLLRLADKRLFFFPPGMRADAAAGGGIAFRYILGAAAVLCLLGAWNAARPRLRMETVEIAKPAVGIRELRIAVASDFHLSPVLRTRFLDRTLNKIKALRPDLVLLPGDIVGEDTPAADREKIAAAFAGLAPPYGVFACTGNHEYFGDLEKNVETLRRGNVRVLLDEAELAAGAFYLVGRKDSAGARAGDAPREWAELTAGLDPGKPLLALSHQPVRLAEPARAGVDLLVCGHTHNGQMFPITQINWLVYEHNHGLHRKDRMFVDVTSGVGTWGPPVRLGTVPEIVLITVRFAAGS
ncbi:MAG TPA: metallophosphoesterase [Candidatus Aminicenantes bacterium]|nr:metallophosphoesterase [Candidatus Aminicenantes bacterium]